MRARIGHFVIEKEIGRGAMGWVWLAYDEILARHVAIKEIFLPENRNPDARIEAVERFKREAQAAACLSHQNVVTILNIEEMDGIPFIIMEYLDGQNLRSMLARGPIDLPLVQDYASQICAALHHAHSQGIIHRDIKPDNIIILKDGRVKVTDFGLARMTTQMTMTQAGMIMGTIGYMSPEQIRGERVDRRTDIFSVGIVIYEMLTGKNPFASDNPASTMYRIVHEAPRPIKSMIKDLPDWIEGVINRAYAKQPEDRYQDALELMQGLVGGGTTPDSHSIGSPAVTACHAPPAVGEPLRPQAPRPSSSTRDDPTRRRSPRLSRVVMISIILVATLAGALGVILAVLLMRGSEVKVPDVEGIRLSEAKDLLEAQGLRVEEKEVQVEGMDKNRIVSQSPEAGQKVAKGSEVTLLVNTQEKEPEVTKITVPNLQGMTADMATQTLTSIGLGVIQKDVTLPGYGYGVVVSQSPEPGQQVAKGSSVHVNVTVYGGSDADAVTSGT